MSIRSFICISLSLLFGVIAFGNVNKTYISAELLTEGVEQGYVYKALKKALVDEQLLEELAFFHAKLDRSNFINQTHNFSHTFQNLLIGYKKSFPTNFAHAPPFCA